MKTMTEMLPNGNLLVMVPINLRNRGNGKEIFLPDGVSENDSRMAFLTAVARGRRWQQLIDDGKVSDIRELARLIGRDNSYVSRIIRLTTLAPQIIESVINGELPPTLNAARARKTISWHWNEQVKEFLKA